MVNSIWMHKRDSTLLVKVDSIVDDVLTFEMLTEKTYHGLTPTYPFHYPVGHKYKFLHPVGDIEKYFYLQYKGAKKISELLFNGVKLRMSYFGPGAYIQMVDGVIVNHDGKFWGPNKKANYSLDGEWYLYEKLHG